MNRLRFNKLLEDPSQVDNHDIRQLNEYRKKYPYFQSLYVVVAKALKEREHPKTEAFIKKAAIYSANRTHLKNLIENEFDFMPLPAKPKAKPKKATETQADLKPDLTELEATKLRIEAMLRGDSPDASNDDDNKAMIDAIQGKVDAKISKEETEAADKAKKAGKKNQIELIEKFISEDPRMDIQRELLNDNEQIQIDLAEQRLKEADTFITETMAKLMAQQGKIKRAVDIYQKLSLKFPEKSDYFASQIQKVKSKHNV